MSIFDSLTNSGGASFARQQGQIQNPMQMLQQLKRNPVEMLRQRGMNIPDGMTNPQQIVQHLVQSGQIPQARFQQMSQMMMGRR